MCKNISILIISLLSYILLIVSASAQGSSLNYSYCKAGNFTNKCVESGIDPQADEASCNAIKQQTETDCQVYLNSLIGRMDGLFQESLTIVTEHLVATTLTVVTAISTISATYFRSAFHKLKARLLDPFLKRSSEYSTIGVNALVVGKGGTGKTSLIRALSGSEHADPAVATATNNLFSLAHETNCKLDDVAIRQLLRVFLSDHVGQDFGTIRETAFYQERKISALPRCIIFVVDILPPEPYGEDAQFDGLDKKRVKEHLSVFSDDMIRAITHDIGTNDKILLFVNKLDKLKNINETKIKAIKSSFSPLINSLMKIRGVELRVVFGSAKTGWGITGAQDDPNNPTVYSTLMDSAKPIRS